MLIASIAEFTDKIRNMPLTESETWLWVAYVNSKAEMCFEIQNNNSQVILLCWCVSVVS